MAAAEAGVVREVLPNGLFRVELGDGRRLVAHVAGKMRMNLVRLIAGDEVEVELTALDPTKGRIVARKRQ